jgi:hypothetical protein
VAGKDGKMTLKNILRNYTWLNIKPKLLELYPDEENNGNLPLYEEVLEKLRFMIPEDSDIMLNITWQHDELDNESNVDVSGKDLDMDKSQPIEADACAIEFTSWNKWLGMEITNNTLKDFTELEILCHSLYEMTFFDFDEDSIQNEIKRIQDIAADFDNMSKEEKRNHTRSIEDFLKELEDEEQDKQGE